MVVFLTRDLIILSNARSALPPGGVLEQAATVQRLQELAGANEIRLVLVDLQMPGLQLEQLQTVLAGADLLNDSVLFAQHVNVRMLKRARETFPRVITRGQLNTQLPELLTGS
ncbi:MAG: hypothetical protein MK108_11780 [Mariniblastus sp.]|nr:hypothetical protein [Mariniblastus sp.]